MGGPTRISWPSMRTWNTLRLSTAGGPITSPVATLNTEPCNGHSTCSPSRAPSAREDYSIRNAAKDGGVILTRVAS